MTAISSLAAPKFDCSEKHLTKVVCDIYNPAHRIPLKEARIEQLITIISNKPTIKAGIQDRSIQFIQEIRLLNEFKEILELFKESHIRNKFSDLNTRFKILIKSNPSLEDPLKGNEHAEIASNILSFINLEQLFIKASQEFVETYQKMFKASWNYYDWLIKNESVLDLTNTGTFNIKQDLSKNLNETDRLALLVLFEPQIKTSQEDIYQRLNKIIQKVLLSSNLVLRNIGLSMCLMNQRQQASICFNQAHANLNSLYQILFDQLLTAKSRYLIATPILTDIAYHYTGFTIANQRAFILTNQGNSHAWAGLIHIELLKDALQQRPEISLKKVLTAHSLQYFKNIKNKIRSTRGTANALSSQTIQFFYQLKAINKASEAPPPSNATKPNKLPKKKAFKATHVKKNTFEVSTLKTTKEETKRIKTIDSNETSSLTFLDLCLKELSEESPSSESDREDEKKSCELVARESVSASSSTSFVESDWTLVRDFIYHERVSRWNFEFHPSMERIPLTGYEEVTGPLFKIYVKHILTPKIDELIYDRNFSFHERFEESYNNREHRHLIAKINFPGGESEEGVISYAFIMKGHKKICIHRYFSKEPQSDLISAHKEALFTRINSNIIKEVETSAEIIPSEPSFILETRKSAPDATLGFINFEIPKLGVTITVFRHTL